MSLGSFVKQPIEKTDYDIDFREWMTPGDNVRNAVVVVDPPGLTNTQTVVNDPRVKMWFSGGADGVTYRISVTITTEDGRVKQVEYKIKVKDTK